MQWRPATSTAVDEQDPEGTPPARIRGRAARAIVPQSFVRTSELVVLHRDPDRFDLLYRTLWRLVYEPALKGDFADTDLARLRQMAQSVRRDIQKMRSRLAFRQMDLAGLDTSVAWYEPGHYVTELVANILVKRELSLPWILLTPDRSLRWDGSHLRSAPGLAGGSELNQRGGGAWSDAVEALDWS